MRSGRPAPRRRPCPGADRRYLGCWRSGWTPNGPLAGWRMGDGGRWSHGRLIVRVINGLPGSGAIVYTYRLRREVWVTPEVITSRQSAVSGVGRGGRIREQDWGSRLKGWQHRRLKVEDRRLMGRGQAVRRGTLDPVFEGSNPSAPANSRESVRPGEWPPKRNADGYALHDDGTGRAEGLALQ